MAYLTDSQLEKMGFKSFGQHVKISDKASIYNADQMEIGDHVRIDDFCVVSGVLKLGSYIHITPFCLIAGGEKGVVMEDFTTIAYGSQVFSQSDDYSGMTLTNSLIPVKYKAEKKERVTLERYVIVGAHSVILPGVTVAEGCAIGAMTLVTKSTDSWGVYVGSPAKRLKERSRAMLALKKQFLTDEHR